MSGFARTLSLSLPFYSEGTLKDWFMCIVFIPNCVKKTSSQVLYEMGSIGDGYLSLEFPIKLLPVAWWPSVRSATWVVWPPFLLVGLLYKKQHPESSIFDTKWPHHSIASNRILGCNITGLQVKPGTCTKRSKPVSNSFSRRAGSIQSWGSVGSVYGTYTVIDMKYIWLIISTTRR